MGHSYQLFSEEIKDRKNHFFFSENRRSVLQSEEEKVDVENETERQCAH